jgi:hypothetical protein
MRRAHVGIAVVAVLALAAPIGSAQAAARTGTAPPDPLVATWTAKETCRGGGCSPVTGVVRVTGTATALTGVVAAPLWLLGDAKCVHPAGQQVWTLRRVAAGRYEGTSDVYTSDSSPGFNCQHSPFAASWSLTGRNLLTLNSTAYGGIVHTFTRTPPVDEKAPVVAVTKAAARRGMVARLPFTVTDDSGRAMVHVVVVAAGRTFGPVGATRAARGVKQTIGLALPDTVAGAAQYCVWAEDAAGNASARVCAPLTIR